MSPSPKHEGRERPVADYERLRNTCAKIADERDRLRAALAELLRVDDAWHGSVNSEMATARSNARAALKQP